MVEKILRLKRKLENVPELVRNSEPDKIYKIRDSLVKEVGEGVLRHASLEKFIVIKNNTPEAGLASTIRYLTSDNFRDMAKATDIAFGQKYGFLAVTGEINGIRGHDQAMFADVDYTEGNFNGFMQATRIGELFCSFGDCAYNAKGNVGIVRGNRDSVLREFRGDIELVEGNDCNVLQNAQGTIGIVKGNEGRTLQEFSGLIGLVEDNGYYVLTYAEGNIRIVRGNKNSVLRYFMGDIGLVEDNSYSVLWNAGGTIGIVRGNTMDVLGMFIGDIELVEDNNYGRTLQDAKGTIERRVRENSDDVLEESRGGVGLVEASRGYALHYSEGAITTIRENSDDVLRYFTGLMGLVDTNGKTTTSYYRNGKKQRLKTLVRKLLD